MTMTTRGTTRREGDGSGRAIRGGAIALALLLVGIGYGPTMVHDYVPQDQWRAFRYSVRAGSAVTRWSDCAELTAPFYTRSGRPLVWLGECAEHSFTSTIHDLSRLRPLVLALVLATVLLLGRLLTSVMGSLPGGITVAAVMVCSPAYAFMVFQGVTGAAVLFGLCLALASYELLSRALVAGDGAWRIPSSCRFLASATCFVVSCCFYPAFAFVCIPIAYLDFVFDGRRTLSQRLRRFALTLLFYAFCASVYFVAAKAIAAVLFPRVAADDLGVYALSVDASGGSIARKLRMLGHYVAHQMPVLNFFGWPWAAKLGLVTAAISSLLWGRPHDERDTHARLRSVAWASLLVPTVVVASVAPWFASQFDYLGGRHALTAQWLLTGFVCVTVARVARRLAPERAVEIAAVCALLTLVLIPTTLQQRALSARQVRQSEAEIAPMRAAIRGLIARGAFYQLRQFHVVRPTRALDHTRASMRTGSELSTAAITADPAHVSQMFTALLRESLPESRLVDLKVIDCRLDARCVETRASSSVLVLSQSLPGDTPHLLADAFVLDYRGPLPQ